MSSTRRAKDASVFHQNRYASSQEYERGLLANLVAKRCALLDDKADRELLWFVQYLSHQDGGLAGVVNLLVETFPARLQTQAMADLKLKPGENCPAEQVKQIRESFPRPGDYLLKGEHLDHHFLLNMDIISEAHPRGEEWGKAQQNPSIYSATVFFEACAEAARCSLVNELREICLNPESSLTSGPWYFPGLIEALRDFKSDFVKGKNAGAVTALGKKVCEVLDYTAYSRGLTLMQGNARLGKSFAARAWCEQRPGLARFVEVPPSNDEASFFRALARGLGLGNFLKYKVSEIRDRVESVLLAGDLLLVLDEAHRLWPQRNLRYGYPSRINWLMAMANHNVPICAIATPQFLEWQKAAEEKGQWNSAQLTGRITHFESLPADLEQSDLIAVARAVLPEADGQVLRALAVYARASARYLAAIDAISKRARFIASRDGRNEVTTPDVRKAMQESVIPADTKLLCALESARKSKSAAPLPAPLPAPLENPPGADTHLLAPQRSVNTGVLGVSESRHNEEFEVPLIGA